jgi:hypothetical protein
MKKYIVTKAPLFRKNSNGQMICIQRKLAVFYSPKMGKSRYYRQFMDNPDQGLKLLTWSSLKQAQTACDVTNAISGGGYLVEEVQETLAATTKEVFLMKANQLLRNNIYMFKLHQRDEVYVGRREHEFFSIEYEDKSLIYHKDEVEWCQHLPIIQGAFEM